MYVGGWGRDFRKMDEVMEENIIICASALNDLETAKDKAGQRTKKAQARDDWNLAAVRRNVCAGGKEPGDSVKIAVLDSGVNYRESLPVYGHVTELKGVESNPFFEDATGHETAVASLIAFSPDEESIQGINENAAVYSVQRYSDAKKIVGDLIGNGARYDFRTHTWNVSVMRNLSKLCGRKDT